MPPLRDGLRSAARNTYTKNGGRHPEFRYRRKRYEDGSVGRVTSDEGIRRKPLRRLLREA